MCILFTFSMLWAIYIFWINPTEKKKFLLQWQSVGFFFSPIYCPPGEMAVRFLGKVIKHLSWTSHMIWCITHFRSTKGAGWIMCKSLKHGRGLFKQLTLSISDNKCLHPQNMLININEHIIKSQPCKKNVYMRFKNPVFFSLSVLMSKHQ